MITTPKRPLLSIPLLALGLLGAGEPPMEIREPVALTAAPEDGSVFAACASGHIVRLDGQAVADEWRVASALSDLVALDDGRSVVAVDPIGDEILMLLGSEVSVVDRRPVSQPTQVIQVAEHLVVSSMWTRTLTRLPIESAAQRSVGSSFGDAPAEVLELSFEPREMAASSDGTLFVADAFGGRLAVVDTANWRLLAMREILAHNIRGLQVTDDGRLLVAHQILDRLARTTLDDVQWGNLVRNVVREIDVAELLDRSGSSTVRSRLTHLGEFGHGAGDPSLLLFLGSRGTLVTLAGTDELLTLDATTGTQRRLPVGRRPVAALLMDDGRTCVVANSLDGSISFVDLDAGDAVSVALGGSRRDDPVARGRELFFDATLSHHGWMSCHSCHTDGHTTDGLADTLGDDTYGTPKRVLSLLGASETAPYSWNGSQPTLESQIEKTLRTTMHASGIDDSMVGDLVAFLRNLPPPPAPVDAMSSEVVAQGEGHFTAAGCTDCHEPPLFTSADTYTVRLSDEAGAKTFNPPSLRGVGRRPRLFHDGRYQELEHLLARADHPGTDTLDEQQRANVAAYLRTL